MRTIIDHAAKPFWIFRLTSGVAARLIPLAILLFVGATGAYIAIAGALGSALGLASPLALPVIFVAVIVVHEALHGIGFLVFGGRPRFGFAVRGGMPVAFATCPGKRFSKRQFLIIGLLPLIGIGAAAFAVAGSAQFAGYGLLAFSLNTAGACGDVWMVALILQSPGNTMFEDTDGLTLDAYLPAGEPLPRLPHGLDPRGWERPLSWGMAWFGAASLTYLVLMIVEISWARSLNGGAGGTLTVAGVVLAAATPGHARMFQPPVLVAAATVGFLAAAGVARVRRRVSRRPSPS